MDEIELKNHLKRFRKDSRNHRFLLEVECPSNYTGLQIKDSLLAWSLCETAFKSGAAKLIKLSYFPDANTEKMLFDSSKPAMVEKMVQSLKRKPQVAVRPAFKLFQ